MRNIGVLIIIMISLCIMGCSNENYYVPSDIPADIEADEDTFGVTANEFVDLINQDIEANGLPLISHQCNQEEVDDVISRDNKDYEYRYTLYQYKIADGITMELYSFPGFEEKISTIKITCSSDLKETKKNAEKYFTIICQNIEPGFNAEKFMGENFNHHVQVNGKAFFCGTFNETTFNETMETGDTTGTKIYISTVWEEYDLFCF